MSTKDYFLKSKLVTIFFSILLSRQTYGELLKQPNWEFFKILCPDVFLLARQPCEVLPVWNAMSFLKGSLIGLDWIGLESLVCIQITFSVCSV